MVPAAPIAIVVMVAMAPFALAFIELLRERPIEAGGSTFRLVSVEQGDGLRAKT